MSSYTEVVSDSNVAASHTAAVHCYVDAAKRSRSAVNKHQKFFDSDHLNRVDAAKQMVVDFFPITSDVYVNHRGGRGQPFSVVKVANIGNWPANRTKTQALYQKLAALGMYEVCYMKRSNSYIYRIR